MTGLEFGYFLISAQWTDASHDVTGYMGQQLESGEVMSFVSTVRLVSFLPDDCQPSQTRSLTLCVLYRSYMA